MRSLLSVLLLSLAAAFPAGAGEGAPRALGDDLVAPAWMTSAGADEVYRKRASYNDAVLRRIPALGRDLNAVAVGHAMAYEDMVTGRIGGLETATFDRIDWVLRHPPRLMPDETAISPTFKRRFGALEKVFDWAHVLHAQTIDVLVDPGRSDAEKDAEIERLWRFYVEKAPFTVSGLPMNMEYLDSRSWSGQFRRRYPRVNGLFWGYHWLQTTVYDMLWRIPPDQQVQSYEQVGNRYREVELYTTDRDFMPMMGESSPRFAARFPEMANAFDNLHMLHDMVNDILADPSLSERQRDAGVRDAILMVVGSSHAGEAAGSGESGTLHDHRYPLGMPGMGIMKGGDENSMYMSGMGWMNMSECAHCSIPLPEGEPWGATVSMNGWTMRVRCLLCARDMAAETPGAGIIRAATEDPERLLVLISDDAGNWATNIDGVVFLETVADHPECSDWSRAFTSEAAFRAYVEGHPEYAGAKPLTLEEWAARNEGTPDTFQRSRKPNPYRSNADADSGGMP